jgi:hypothetical protein
MKFIVKPVRKDVGTVLGKSNPVQEFGERKFLGSVSGCKIGVAGICDYTKTFIPNFIAFYPNLFSLSFH